jgi:hypothetical protein
MNYVRSHWRGEQPLFPALCVNLVLLRVLILYADRYTLPPYIVERSDALLVTVAFVLLFHGIIYPWQIIGLLRTIDKQICGIHASLWTWLSYMAILASLIFTFLGIAGSFQSLTEDKFIVENPHQMEQDRASKYSLTLDQNAMHVNVKGAFEFGMTENLAKFLDLYPKVTGVVLESDGGQVYEGRGMAYMVKNRKLDTYVYGICKSACATAFIGGANRYLGKNAKLGFHQYGLELKFPNPLYDVKAEQEKEIEFYRLQGITANFLERVFSSPHSNIWFPSNDDLIASGVATDLAD